MYRKYGMPQAQGTETVPRLGLPASFYLLHPWSRAFPAFPPSLEVKRRSGDVQAVTVCYMEDVLRA